ncbi:MAG: hypothetical protein MUE60_07615, partial [Candidatus Eisenbacteria bacterium]|nr:hypothetical protein [Candidatus Eisenbacteria bacterium]
MLGRLVYYGIGIPAAELIARLWGGRNPKIRSALHGNRIPRPRSGVDGAMKLWFHVSSLGEFEQARPVIEAVGARHPDAASWVSFFSPSGLEHARGYPHAADLFYVPFRRRHVQRAFDIIRPDAVVVIRFDLWPGLAWEAAARDVPLLLVNATLRAGSPRNHPLLGPPQRFFYRHVTRVLAATEGDATRLRRLCGPGVPVEVGGDSRYDRVWQRSTAAISLGSLDTVLGTAARPVLVVGSSYEPEERVLVEALAVLGGPSASMSVVVVPHEPTEERLRFAER